MATGQSMIKLKKLNVYPVAVWPPSLNSVISISFTNHGFLLGLTISFSPGLLSLSRYCYILAILLYTAQNHV